MLGKPSTPIVRIETLIEESLEAFLAHKIQEAQNIDKHYKQLWKEIATLIQSGGKRMRPRITVMAYQAFGGTEIEKILPIATAQELLHQSLLVHDDIIDRDYIRYGVENIAGRYTKIYEPYAQNASDRKHYALSAALLAGDLLLSSAHQLIAESNLEPKIKKQVHTLFSQAIFQVAGGEFLDSESVLRPKQEVNTMTIAKYKTASYSYVCPLLIGATLANADSGSCAALRVFAEDLGIAFQLRDDVLGVFGKEEETGKSNETDIKEGKYTHLVECFMQTANTDVITLFNTIFGNQSATTSQIEQVRELFIASGALEQVEAKIAHYESSARKELDFLQLSTQYRERFEELINKSVRRDR